jgi:hypothetical protein
MRLNKDILELLIANPEGLSASELHTRLYAPYSEVCMALVGMANDPQLVIPMPETGWIATSAGRRYLESCRRLPVRAS